MSDRTSFIRAAAAALVLGSALMTNLLRPGPNRRVPLVPLKEECLNRVLLLGERHLRRTIAEFVAHADAERNHQGIGNVLIQPRTRTRDP